MCAISDLETLPMCFESSPIVMHTGKQLFHKELRQHQWNWSCEACALWWSAFLMWDRVSWRISGTQLLHLRSYKTCHSWDWTLWDALLCGRAADHLLRSCKWVVKYMLRQRKLWLPWSARYFIALSWLSWSKRSSIIDHDAWTSWANGLLVSESWALSQHSSNETICSCRSCGREKSISILPAHEQL